MTETMLKVWQFLWMEIVDCEGIFDDCDAQLALEDGEYLGKLKAHFDLSDEEMQEIAEYLHENCHRMDYYGNI